MRSKILVVVATAATLMSGVAFAQSSAVNGAAGGAVTGAIVGGPVGAAVGEVAGAASSVRRSILRRRKLLPMSRKHRHLQLALWSRKRWLSASRFRKPLS